MEKYQRGVRNEDIQTNGHQCNNSIVHDAHTNLRNLRETRLKKVPFRFESNRIRVFAIFGLCNICSCIDHPSSSKIEILAFLTEFIWRNENSLTNPNSKGHPSIHGPQYRYMYVFCSFFTVLTKIPMRKSIVKSRYWRILYWWHWDGNDFEFIWFYPLCNLITQN